MQRPSRRSSAKRSEGGRTYGVEGRGFYYIAPMEPFLLAFVPLFVAIDPIGTLGIFLGLTEPYSPSEKRRFAFQAVLTAFFVGLAFEWIGHHIFSFLGITPADFKIAGGVLLLIFSIREIFGNSTKFAETNPQDNLIGIVPMGVPLIAGPAFITTLLILSDMHAPVIVTLAMAANMVITFLLFAYSDWITKRTGEVFGRVMAKLVAIFLAAIGIMMIRKGLETFLLRN